MFKHDQLKLGNLPNHDLITVSVLSKLFLISFYFINHSAPIIYIIGHSAVCIVRLTPHIKVVVLLSFSCYVRGFTCVPARVLYLSARNLHTQSNKN